MSFNSDSRAYNQRRTKKICMMTVSHPVKYSRFWDREARSLHQGGYQVTLIGLGNEFKIEFIDGIKTIAVPERKRWHKFALVKEIAQLAFQEHADVYQCLDPWCLAIGLWLKRFSRPIHIVYESSEWFPQTYLDRRDFPLVLRWLSWSLVSYLEYTACCRAEAIIETNYARAHRFSRRGRIPIQVPNYPPVELIGAPEQNRNPWFVYTGLICRPRGFHQLLKALALVVKQGFYQVKLIVRGEFDRRDDIERWAKGFINRNGLAENVVFVSSLPSYAEVFNIIKPCLAGLILLQPERGNDWTNQPNKLFEFMGCGLSVIASNFPEIARIVNETKCGWLVDPTQPEAIARAMVEVLENPAESIRRGFAGRKAVETKYNWQIAEDSLLNTYRAIFQKTGD